jgi:hypothetical protein
MTKNEQLRERTKQFAIRVIRLFRALPGHTDAQIVGKQLLRCGTSVAANYRAVCRARSKAEFIARLGVVAEEPMKAFLAGDDRRNEDAEPKATGRDIEGSKRTGCDFFGVLKNS